MVAFGTQQGLKYGTYYSGQKGGGKSKTSRLLIVGVIVAAVLGLVMFALTFFSNNAKSDITLLGVRENSLLTLVNTSQKIIRNADLANANSNAALLLTSDVASIIKDTGSKKLPDNLVKQEADTNGDTLKQASLLDKFDPTYRQIVIQKVTPLLSEAQSVKAKVSNKKSRAVIDQAITNLQSISKQFTDLSVQ